MSAEDRPTKKQREILSFIDNFISGHGYGPSYREVQSGLGYRSVATVAAHIDNLIAKGHLRKRNNSARSLEVIGKSSDFNIGRVTKEQEKWLVEEIGRRFAQKEADPTLVASDIDNLYVLVGALKVLGFDGAANSFKPRLASLKKLVEESR
jgi:SOS-response transcriptional repressor LexA